MDLVFKRYASPFSLIDSMIGSCQFNKWIDKVLDEEKDDILWDLYLHKCFSDASFDEFKKMCSGNATNQQKMTQKEFEMTIQNSKDMMENFVPDNMERG